MINRFERFSVDIMEIFHYWHTITSEEMAKYGLKGTHCTYFTVLSRYKEGVTATHLCKLCAKDKADVSRSVALFEKKGLVVKETGGDNVYRARIVLTEDGRKIADAIRERVAVAVEMAGEGISEKERKIFYEALETITENLARMSHDGLPE